jgi:flagellar basal body-associated protein FliL
MESIWTIIGVLLVQFALGGSFYAGYRVGQKKQQPKLPAEPMAEDEKARLEQVKKAFRAVAGYDITQAVKRREDDGRPA